MDQFNKKITVILMETMQIRFGLLITCEMNIPTFAAPPALPRKASSRRRFKQCRRPVASAAETLSLTRRAFLLAAAGVPAAYDAWAKRYNALDGRNALTGALGFTAARRSLLSRADGDVLEVGVGTGVNLPLYDRATLRSLTGIDASSAMLSQAADNADASKAVLLQADVSELPFHSNSFDTVVDTFSLCTFGDSTSTALLEFRRVLRPGARLLLLEHTASDSPYLRVYQNATAPVVTKFSKGCRWNQRVEEMAHDVGFSTVYKETLLAGTVVLLELVAPQN